MVSARQELANAMVSHCARQVQMREVYRLQEHSIEEPHRMVPLHASRCVILACRARAGDPAYHHAQNARDGKPDGARP